MLGLRVCRQHLAALFAMTRETHGTCTPMTRETHDTENPWRLHAPSSKHSKTPATDGNEGLGGTDRQTDRHLLGTASRDLGRTDRQTDTSWGRCACAAAVAAWPPASPRPSSLAVRLTMRLPPRHQ
jgi:hypothetical protein